MKFRNPILPRSADPWFILKDGWYYYCYAMQDVGIYVSRSRTLTRAQDGITSQVWPLPHPLHPFEEAWAPELHYIGGKWYIYVAARTNREDLHRIFVLEAVTEDPQGEYNLKGEIYDENYPWMIDGTPFEKDGEWFLVWSGIQEGEFRGDKNYFYGEQRLYIAKLQNPWSIEQPHLLAFPTFPWEMHGPTAVNEGPQVLQRNNRLFITFSASHSFTDEYCLGMLEFTGENILDFTSWTKYPEPVFCRSDNVLGPGHASFTTSPDGTEDWITYHVTRASGSNWKRQIHAQKFTWTVDGYPCFGAPVSTMVEMPLPSGEEVEITRDRSSLLAANGDSVLTLKASLNMDKEDFEVYVSDDVSGM
jgi:GH43 family beta-xylosidase